MSWVIIAALCASSAPTQSRDHATEVANVADYGAKGDGAADDTAAIAKAIETGRPVVFPAGTFKVTSTLVGRTGSWTGAGPGSAYDSNASPGATVIRCAGPLAPCAVPPALMEGLQFDGVDRRAVGLRLGEDGAFVGFRRWRRIHVRNFDRGIDMHNFFSTALEGIVVQGNHRGIRISPSHAPKSDSGYFTSTAWRDVYIADNDVYGLEVSPPLGDRTWHWENVIIERNGASGAYQARLENVSVSAVGLYLEGSPKVPALQLADTTLWATNGFASGTGGIDLQSKPNKLFLSRFLMSSKTDRFSNLSMKAYLVARDGSFLQADPRLVLGDHAIVEMSEIAGSGFAARAHTRDVTIAEYGDTVSFDADLGKHFIVSVTNGDAFTIQNPVQGVPGGRITIRIRNVSSVAIGHITWGDAYRLAPWSSPRAGMSRAIDFQFDGRNWVEVARTPADVPN